MIDMADTIIELAGGGHVEHVAWPALAEQIETGDFVSDIGRIREEIGWTAGRVASGWVAEDDRRSIDRTKPRCASRALGCVLGKLQDAIPDEQHSKTTRKLTPR